MQDELLDDFGSIAQETNAIDGFFKSAVIFYGLILLLSFLSGPFADPSETWSYVLLIGLIASVVVFNIFYLIFLIRGKKRGGRILLNVLHACSTVVIAVCFILYFYQGGPFMLLSVGLITAVFLCCTQLIYELAVRKSSSKFYNVLSFVGISIFSMGIYSFLKRGMFGDQALVIGGVTTLFIAMLHLGFALKKGVESQIHIRYLAQCLFAIYAAVLILLA